MQLKVVVWRQNLKGLSKMGVGCVVLGDACDEVLGFLLYGLGVLRLLELQGNCRGLLCWLHCGVVLYFLDYY